VLKKMRGSFCFSKIRPMTHWFVIGGVSFHTAKFTLSRRRKTSRTKKVIFFVSIDSPWRVDSASLKASVSSRRSLARDLVTATFSIFSTAQRRRKNESFGGANSGWEAFQGMVGTGKPSYTAMLCLSLLIPDFTTFMVQITAKMTLSRSSAGHKDHDNSTCSGRAQRIDFT